MKNLNKIILALSFGVLANFTNAQQIADLEGINYQAVAIDTDGKEVVGKDVVGKPLYKKDIGVKFTITSGAEGSIYYQEEHSTTTDDNGLFSLNIGLGELTSETDYTNLLDMPWINGDQWLTVEIAIGDDGDYELVSNQKFMSVPYAYYTDDIADDAITTEKILDSTILNQDMSTSSVDTRVIEDSTILNEDISTGSVDTRVIEDSTILNQDMSTGSVDTRVIEDSTILNEDMSTGSVDTRIIEDSTILNEDMSTASVDTRVIEDSTILNEDMSTGSVDSRVIENESILNEDIADGTIDLTSKVTNVLQVENGGTGQNNLIQEGILIGNGTDPVTVFPPLDSGQVITHINGVTEIYKLEAGPRMDITYDDVNKTITFSAVNQSSTGLTYLATENTFSVPGEDQVILTYNVPGVVPGDIILPVINADLQELTLTGYVSANDFVTVVFVNGNTTVTNLGTIDISMINIGQ
ncbi:MAG: hypothetical protein WED10_10765 [Brumimicrobium sp.]